MAPAMVSPLKDHSMSSCSVRRKVSAAKNRKKILHPDFNPESNGDGWLPSQPSNMYPNVTKIIGYWWKMKYWCNKSLKKHFRHFLKIEEIIKNDVNVKKSLEILEREKCNLLKQTRLRQNFRLHALLLLLKSFKPHNVVKIWKILHMEMSPLLFSDMS